MFIKKVLIYSLIIILISGFLAVLLLVAFWFFLNLGFKVVYLMTILLSVVIFFSARVLFIKIKAAEKTKTEFILSAIHRLRTSVAATKWSLKMLLDKDFGKINKEQKDVIERLYKKNESLAFLLKDLFEATKIEEGAYIYHCQLTDIEEIVRSAIDSFQDEIKRKKIKFEFKKSPEKLPKIMLDKEKIGVVIQNLFDNALKYTASEGSIVVSLRSDGKEIEFQIKDSGIGIPENQQAEIFNKFFIGANVNKAETNGFGLGLYIAKKIINSHHGRIWFESKENKGSTFSFSVPIE